MLKTKKINLTKKDIAKKLYSKIGLSFQLTSKISEDFLKILKKLIKDGNLNIKNFGTFKILNKNERSGMNPKNQEKFVISARKTISFIASKKIKYKIEGDK